MFKYLFRTIFFIVLDYSGVGVLGTITVSKARWGENDIAITFSQVL